MPAEAWIGLASLAVLILNGLFLVVFIAGKHANRIKVLEDGARKNDLAVEALKGDLAHHKAQTSALDATLTALKETVSDGFRDMKLSLQEVFARRGRARPAD